MWKMGEGSWLMDAMVELNVLCSVRLSWDEMSLIREELCGVCIKRGTKLCNHAFFSISSKFVNT